MSDAFEVVAESISGSQWGFGIDPQWVPALAYDIVHGLKVAGFGGLMTEDYPEECCAPEFLGIKRTVRKFADGWTDAIHDHVGEELAD